MATCRNSPKQYAAWRAERGLSPLPEPVAMPTKAERELEALRATAAVQGSKLARIADAICQAQGSNWVGAPGLCNMFDSAHAIEVIRAILMEKGANRGG